MNPKLLDILVCPLTKTKLVYDRDRQWLVSTAAKKAYPIRDDIPILLADEAVDLDEDTVERYRKQKSA
ncbi:Trm112 family protein [Sulfurivirga sp.]|uniref:Trm112 family protein n=1 Tax=Sulfurivirga sp. TaxID=2614236 RepID=UPI0025FE3031|nr:Trm112 family protein [Sulfurivirga sp.]